jgi:hypothetical protein
MGGVFNPINLALYTYAAQNPLRYVDPDGNENRESYDSYTKIGGSRAWRNNNPGNIEYGNFAKGQGAVGVEKAGRFAKFSSPEAGMAALKGLLGGSKYKDLNVVDAMKQYAPSKENNTEAYIKFLEKQGVDIKDTVGKQTDKMADAIKKYEGWIPGTVEPKARTDSPPPSPPITPKETCGCGE